MISVIIPVLNQSQITFDLLCQIRENVYKPYEVIIIDNGSNEKIYKLVKNFRDLNINYIRLNNNIGVNKAWNLGIKESKSDIISILNNDIVINKFFFNKIKETMENKEIGICVPNTVTDKLKVYNDEVDENTKLTKSTKREGWAFTIRKDIIDKFGYIPEELDRTFGDDYLFYCAGKMKYQIVKMKNNYIYHYGGLTTIKEFIDKNIPYSDKETERKIWTEIKKNIDGK